MAISRQACCKLDSYWLTSCKISNELWPSDAILRGKLRYPLHWRQNDHDGVSNHQPRGCLLNCLFRCRSKKTSKLPRHWPLCGEFTGTGEFPAQRASYAENVSIWWRHHAFAGGIGLSSFRRHTILGINVYFTVPIDILIVIGVWALTKSRMINKIISPYKILQHDIMVILSHLHMVSPRTKGV